MTEPIQSKSEMYSARADSDLLQAENYQHTLGSPFVFAIASAFFNLLRLLICVIDKHLGEIACNTRRIR